jgi:hypothetical protein
LRFIARKFPAPSVPWSFVITADFHACRQPKNEVINPARPNRIPAASPGQRQIGIVRPFTLGPYCK